MADDQQPGAAPRGRGRARGRSRGATVEPARRPGEEPPPPVMVQPVQPAPMGGGGRRTHRGVTRMDPKPGEEESVANVAAGVAGMGISEGAAGRGIRYYSAADYLAAATRPEHIEDKTGKSGEQIEIVANFFKLISRPQWCVYQYHCDFNPVVESSSMRRDFIGEHREKLGSCYIFDGMSDLKTATKLEKDVTELFSRRRTDGETIIVTLKRVAELAPSHPELQRLFNTQMRRNLHHLNFQLLGRHYFDQNSITAVPQFNLQIWQGIITSIRQQEEALMMSVDTIHKIVRQETALEVISNILQHGGSNEACSKELIGAIVITKYNNRTYRVEEIDWSKNPKKTFDMKGTEINYIDYYKKQYNIDVGDHGQPLMLCTSKEREVRAGASASKKIYLIPHLCCLTGLTDSMRANFTLMRELANTTRLDPCQRVTNLQTFIRSINRNEKISTEMNAWGLKFSDDLVQLQGRIVPQEQIVSFRSKAFYNQVSGDFSKEMRGKQMFVAKGLHNWLIICTKMDHPKANDFVQNLFKVGPPMGMEIEQPQVVCIHQDRIGNYIQACRENIKPDTSIVVFVVPNNKKDRYDALKKHTCLDIAIPSQVIVARTLSKKPMLMSVATKVAIQMSCKLGGEPWAMEIPLKLSVMVIGFDTYHDSMKKGHSAGAFVASMNPTFTRWYSKVVFHAAGGWQELSNYLRNCFTIALKKFHQINQKLPNLILFYRDGVGDGQIRYVKEWEVAQFTQAIDELIDQKGGPGAPKTKFAFTIVNKRINTRFFAKRNGQFGNPPPGTVVDHTVTRYDRYDFYLVSQSVRQGTVSPTMYNIIEDNSGLKPEHMQRLAYKLTHLYYNWQGTIRVPAPCQYAHKLAFLCGQSLHHEPREELCDTLFYL